MEILMESNYVRFNPYNEAFQADPFGVYSELLLAGPLHRTRTGLHVAVGYDLCSRILADDRFRRGTKGRQSWRLNLESSEELEIIGSEIMLNLDPPHHSTVRDPFVTTFLRREIAQHDRFIWDEAHRLTDALPRRGSVELVDAFALPLTLNIIQRILGIESCDQGLILDFVRSHLFVLELKAPVRQQLETAKHASSQLQIVLERELDMALANTPLGRLKDAIAAGELSRESALLNIVFVLSAGFETTINLLCAGFYLLKTSGMSDRCTEKKVANEVMRLAPSIHMTTRIVGENTELDGISLNAGDQLLVVIAGANRDPNIFNEPDKFDPDRVGPSALSFGAGPHYCLGVNLARREAEIGWKVLADKFSDVDVDRISIEYEKRAAIRTPSRLNIEQ
jgi:cytochrome P450